MIDSSKSPLPLWRRYATAGFLTVLLVVMGYVVWAKELHHSASSNPPAASATVGVGKASSATVPAPPPTTVPGGVPISKRDPFGS